MNISCLMHTLADSKLHRIGKMYLTFTKMFRNLQEIDTNAKELFAIKLSELSKKYI